METITALLCLIGISTGCKPSGPPSYLSFSRHRSQTYYSNFANACNQLIANTANRSTNEIQLNGDDTKLPTLLRDLHATSIDVGSNNVTLLVDILAGYAVVWHADDSNSNLWKLTVRSEAEPKDVLVRTNK
jgi:hypothetical protein